MVVTILAGHVLTKLAEIEPNSVQVCATSPPFYGLRSYGTAPQTWPDGWVGELGLEPTLALYLDHLLMVFDAVKRVLRDDGTCWVNLGDSFTSGGRTWRAADKKSPARAMTHRAPTPDGMKPKDLMLVPHRFAIRMQEAGWWVRNDLVWAKPSCMPESVTDRATRSHEYIFHFAKNARYYYDHIAVQETPVVPWGGKNEGVAPSTKDHHLTSQSAIRDGKGRMGNDPNGRNQRTIWSIGPEPLKDAHYAAWPTAIPRRCILAGSSQKGQCPACGAPWVRQTKVERSFQSGSGRAGNLPVGKNGAAMQGGGATLDIRRGPTVSTETTGWSPSCACDAGDPVPQTILDPFSGSGRTGIVAHRLGRHCIGIELSPTSVAISERLIRGDASLVANVEVRAMMP